MANRKVFVSYSIDDRVFADQLREALIAERNVQVLDPTSALAAVNEVDDLVIANLKGSDLFVYIVPEKEGSGKLSLYQLGAAKALGKRIVAVLPDSARVANSAVAARLADALVVDQDRASTKEIARRILEKAA
jgi:hypothetical protein